MYARPTYLVMPFLIFIGLLAVQPIRTTLPTGKSTSAIPDSPPKGSEASQQPTWVSHLVENRKEVFSGIVVSFDGKPIANATVSIGKRSTATNRSGSFQIEVLRNEQYILNITHPDYADISTITRRVIAKKTWQMVRAQITTVNPKQDTVLVDTRKILKQKKLRGAAITLKAGSLVDANGNPPVGDVRAAIATLDIANGESPGDWAVRSDEDNREGYLVSYGAVFVQFTDMEAKTKYQLAKNSPAQISIPVPRTMQKDAIRVGRTPLWYYDSNDGLWKKAGKTKYDRRTSCMVGTVNHLSTINTDIAKFDNAACLKITLDPSVAIGSTLRIRYHSGGTAFGQTPTFLMNDTVNAAYRLPANTNVLFELLDSSNNVVSNLVVEDPPGSPVVNNVVNTGTAIPAGDTLWPPAPFDGCKPVLLKRITPQVEIQINELASDPDDTDFPTDDYITWAPTFCRARLTSPLGSDVTAVLTNDSPGAIAGGGDVMFAADQSPWPVNTTANQNSISLTLPGDGSWAPFVIAGKFQSPSTNDKDTIIEAHMSSSAGVLMGTKALMVRVRKNGNTLTSGERDRFLFAMRKLRNQAGSGYLMFQEMHRLAATAGDEGHGQPAFYSWHRGMLLHVERELQKIDPTVALHYWNWDAAAPNIFTEDFLGAPDTSAGFITEPIFSVTNPLNGWNTDLPFNGGELRRNVEDHTLAPDPSVFKPLDHPVDPDLIGHADFGPRSSSSSFSYQGERESHNPAHGWPCAGGHLISPQRSACDPLFYFLHSQIDRQWAYWQWINDRHGIPVGSTLTFPAPSHFDNNGNWNDPGVTSWQRGSFLEDGMWPWDGATGGTPGTRDWRPANQATAPGTNIPLTQPVVPGTPFATSPVQHIWPSAPTVIKNRHTIDYLGRFKPQDGLGFCYDDVPYQ